MTMQTINFYQIPTQSNIRVVEGDNRTITIILLLPSGDSAIINNCVVDGDDIIVRCKTGHQYNREYAFDILNVDAFEYSDELYTTILDTQSDDDDGVYFRIIGGGELRYRVSQLMALANDRPMMNYISDVDAGDDFSKAISEIKHNRIWRVRGGASRAHSAIREVSRIAEWKVQQNTYSGSGC